MNALSQFPRALELFWRMREHHGTTSGRHMKAVEDLISHTLYCEGRVHVSTNKHIKGFFREGKRWDVVLESMDGRLLGVIELKSQCGPSFGNNFNNRIEEAIGNAVDLRRALRGTANSSVFVAYVFILEDCSQSEKYAKRYEHALRCFASEGLYDSVCMTLTKADGSTPTHPCQDMTISNSIQKIHEHCVKHTIEGRV
jgi:Restriction endonuclease XhoI